MEKFLDKLIERDTIDISAKLIIAVIVLAIRSKIIKAIESNLRKENKLKHLDASVKGFLISFISITSKIVLFIVVLHILGSTNSINNNSIWFLCSSNRSSTSRRTI